MEDRTMLIRRLAGLFVLALVLPTATAVAQPLGTFRWQIQPYCNVLTVTVSQQGGIYTLDGTDDRCAATQAASVVGIAFLNPSGSVGFGLTVVLPNGTPIHIEATVTVSSLNGTWRDSAGNSGTFIFTPGAGIGGSPRPVPAGGIAPLSITAVHLAPAAVGAVQLADNAVSGSHIVDGSITAADLIDEPRAAFAGGEQFLPLTITAAIVRTVSITAPTAGRIVVNASGYFFMNAASIDSAGCSITQGTAIDNNNLNGVDEGVANAMDVVPLGMTRGLAVSAGTHTINLVCTEFTGDVSLGDSSLTATFISG
jgi:hypothetical protein